MSYFRTGVNTLPSTPNPLSAVSDNATNMCLCGSGGKFNAVSTTSVMRLIMSAFCSGDSRLAGTHTSTIGAP